MRRSCATRSLVDPPHPGVPTILEWPIAKMTSCPPRRGEPARADGREPWTCTMPSALVSMLNTRHFDASRNAHICDAVGVEIALGHVAKPDARSDAVALSGDRRDDGR